MIAHVFYENYQNLKKTTILITSSSLCNQQHNTLVVVKCSLYETTVRLHRPTCFRSLRTGTCCLCRNQVRPETNSGVARNLIWGVYVLTSHCSFKTYVNVPHVNKTVTDFGGIIPIYPQPHRYAPETNTVTSKKVMYPNNILHCVTN